MASASAEDLVAFTSGRWAGEVKRDAADGTFESCRATALDRARTLVTLEVDVSSQWSIVLSNEGWHLPPGRHYRLSVMFDSGPALQWDSAAANSAELKIEMGLDPTLVGLLQTSHVVRIKSGSFDKSYDLGGTAAAINSLLQCRQAALVRDQERMRTAIVATRASLDVAVVALAPVAPIFSIRLGMVLHPTQVSVVAPARRQPADPPPVPANPALPRIPEVPVEVPLSEEYGTFVAPVTVNGVITLGFTVDSGAADISLPADVVQALESAGTVAKADFRGSRTYQFADGSTGEQRLLMIHSLRVGGLELENLMATESPVGGGLLLGQGFFTKLDSWSIDNGRRILILKPKTAFGSVPPSSPEAASGAPWGQADLGM